MKATSCGSGWINKSGRLIRLPSGGSGYIEPTAPLKYSGVKIAFSRVIPASCRELSACAGRQARLQWQSWTSVAAVNHDELDRGSFKNRNESLAPRFNSQDFFSRWKMASRGSSCHDNRWKTCRKKELTYKQRHVESLVCGKNIPQIRRFVHLNTYRNWFSTK